MNNKMLSARLFAFTLVTTSVFAILGCKQSDPTYSQNNIAQNNDFAAKQAKFAAEAQLKQTPLPNMKAATDGGTHSLAQQK